MNERRRNRHFKKFFAALMSVILLISMFGGQTMLKVNAAGEPPTITYSFDDRGKPDASLVAVDGNWVRSGDVNVASLSTTYNVKIIPPSERAGMTPIVDIRMFSGETLLCIYSSTPFWDDVSGNESEPNLSLSQGGETETNTFTFSFTTPAEYTHADVNIWWSDFDRAGGWYDTNSDSGEFCLEVCGNGGGEAYLNGISEYPVLWEYTDTDPEGHSFNYGGQKILIPSELFSGKNEKGIELKFCVYEGNSFERFQINNPIEGADPIGVIEASKLEPDEEPKYILTKDLFISANGYLNSELMINGGRPPFNIFYDDQMGDSVKGSVLVSGPKAEEGESYSSEVIGSGSLDNFLFGGKYTIKLCPPDNRQEDCVPIVEVNEFKSEEEPPIIYSTRDGSLSVNEEREFNVNLPTEDNFCGVDVNIWWSEFDSLSGWYDDEKKEGEYCLLVRNDGNGEAYFEGNPYLTFWEFNGKDSETGNDIGYGNQKFMIPRKDVEEKKAVLKFSPYEGCTFREFEIEFPGQNPIRKEAKDFAGDPEYQLSTSEFDRDGNINTSVRFDTGNQPGEGFTVFYRVEGDGTVLFEPNFDTTDNNGWKVGSLKADEITINISPYEGCVLSNLKIDDDDFAGAVVNNEYSWKLHSGENYIEVFFADGNNPGPGGSDSPAERLKGFIEGQQYIFGDWNMDEEVNLDDLKQGMAQQIFYPQFSDPRSHLRLKEAYPEIESYSDLVSKITIVEKDSSKDIKATAGNNEEYIIPAYKYTFAFEDNENSERNVNVEGFAWLFDFSDESIYSTDSASNVIMEIKDEEGNSSFFLRNCGRDSADCIDPATNKPSGEGAFCAIGDYKVEFDSARNKYNRSVAIYGNGASLDDFLMTEDSEIEMCTFQGRNDMLVRDAFGEGNSHPVIFGKFSFYKDDFSGMKIQGDGAAGNTPAWAFATDPIWGTGDETGTEKEAIVYFGNEKVYFSPITVNGNVSDIIDIKKTDTSIPDGAVKVYQDGDKWVAEFFTNFYDKVEFTVTYETNDGPKTEYIVVHRVGIDIQATTGGNSGETKTIYHGTENGPEYTFSESCETLVYATYYYPEENGTTELVDLYATYTWKDGSVTKEVIHNDSSLHLSYHHPDYEGSSTDDVQSDDFILYQGSKSGAPQKIEVSAVVAGFESKTSFTGMRLGSGKGVCWNNNIEN